MLKVRPTEGLRESFLVDCRTALFHEELINLVLENYVDKHTLTKNTALIVVDMQRDFVDIGYEDTFQPALGNSLVVKSYLHCKV